MAIINLNYQKSYLGESGKRIGTKSLIECDDCKEQRIIDKSGIYKGSNTQFCHKCNSKGKYDQLCLKYKIQYIDPIPSDIGKKIRWVCHDGHFLTKSYRGIAHTNGCKKCFIKEKCLTLAAEREIEFIPPFPENVKSITTWKCKCGSLFKRSITNLDASKGLCKKCINILIGKNSFTGYEEISGQYWSTTQRNASVRDLEFNITIEYAYNLFLKQNKQCALSGVDISFGEIGSRRPSGTESSSLDRIDSSKGYIEGNVQWVHKDINYIKMDLDQDYFLLLCGRIFNNLWKIGERRWNPDSPFYQSK